MKINFPALNPTMSCKSDVYSLGPVAKLERMLVKLFYPTSLVIASVLLSTNVNAQDDPQYSQNMYTRLQFNSAYAGSSGGVCATALYRTQWVGFEGAPRTANFSIDGLVPALHGGLGLNVYNDQIGAYATTSFKLAYAYRMRLGDQGRLALGLDAGIVQRSLDGLVLRSASTQNGVTDPNIPNTKVGDMTPDFGFGVYFNTNDFYFGISALHLNEGKFSNNSGLGIGQLRRHYYAMGGFNYDFAPTWTLKPSIFLKSDFVSTQVDANLTLLYNNLVWAGVSYRYEDAYSIMLGLNITSQLRLGYAYDYTTSPIKAYSSGSHEVMLKYCFKINMSKPSYINRNVRFL